MGDAFFKSLKWVLSAALIIGGIACISYAESRGSAVPLMLAVFSFGGAYILSSSWRSLPWKAVVLSILFVIGLGVLARYVPDLMWVALGRRVDMDYFMIWVLMAAGLGVPLMTVLFHYFEE